MRHVLLSQSAKTIVLSALWISAFAIASARTARAEIYSVTDRGAIPDGKTINTQALQKTIDTCSAAGGGTVFFPAGTYLTGTLVLRDRVTLQLESGAILLGSTHLEDYPPHTPTLRSYTDVNYVDKSLIYAEKIHDVAIIGQGTIDGQGGHQAFKNKPYKSRPYLLRFIECRNVTLRDVTLKDSAMWVQHYLGCENVSILGVTVNSLVNGNNDGIDIDGCDRFRVANCDIASVDDSIVLKSTLPRPCRRVTITNCVLRSMCNALKCGTESTGGFEDITITNCVIYDTRLSGIALEAVDGGTLDRVLISNISMVNTKSAILLRLGNRARPYMSEGPGGHRGTFTRQEDLPKPGVAAFRNVVISNVVATGVDNTGCAIAGIPGHPIENVTLQNIRITYAGGGDELLINREVPENEEQYPEYSMLGKLPAYGFYCRHARNIKFDNIRLDYEKPEARPALFCEDVDGLKLADFDAKPPTSGDGMRFVNVTNGPKAPEAGSR